MPNLIQRTDIPISTNIQMSNCLHTMNDQFEQAARHNVQIYLNTIGEEQSFTYNEQKAMVKLEQLKLIGDLTLAEVLLRGQVIREIEAYGYWSTHPMGFSSMNEAAQAQGISQSEYSNIRDLTEVIFPYLNTNGYNIADLWESIGKSKFRELIPILKRVITNERSRSNRVEAIFENAMDDIHATTLVQGENITDETAREILVAQLIEEGQLPVREIRRRMHRNQTPSIQAYHFPFRNNQAVVLMMINEDQEENLNESLGGHIALHHLTQKEVGNLDLLQEIINQI